MFMLHDSNVDDTLRLVSYWKRVCFNASKWYEIALKMQTLFGMSTEQPAAAPKPMLSNNKERTPTAAGCTCKDRWGYKDANGEMHAVTGGKCAAPDGDPGGEWCFLKPSTECLWGKPAGHSAEYRCACPHAMFAFAHKESQLHRMPSNRVNKYLNWCCREATSLLQMFSFRQLKSIRKWGMCKNC